MNTTEQYRRCEKDGRTERDALLHLWELSKGEAKAAQRHYLDGTIELGCLASVYDRSQDLRRRLKALDAAA